MCTAAIGTMKDTTERKRILGIKAHNLVEETRTIQEKQKATRKSQNGLATVLWLQKCFESSERARYSVRSPVKCFENMVDDLGSDDRRAF
jgi:hypothetical protein